MLPVKIVIPPEVKSFTDHLAFWQKEAHGMRCEYLGWLDAKYGVNNKLIHPEGYFRERYEEGHKNATAKLREEAYERSRQTDRTG